MLIKEIPRILEGESYYKEKLHKSQVTLIFTKSMILDSF